MAALPPRHRLEEIVRDIVAEIGAVRDCGRTTDRIPALAARDPHAFGIALFTRDGDVIRGGDADTRFSIQSISKLFALELALEAYGEALFERVGREPSGDPFNSIIDLERHCGHPRNPFINAGALIVVDMLVERFDAGRELRAVIDFVSGLLDGAEVSIDEDVARADEDGSDLNRALLRLARHFGNVRCDVDRVIDAYVHQCAIELSCAELARVGRFLMLEGPDARSRPRGEAGQRARRIMSMMTTCGQYDGAGAFAWRVGLPAKSGIGGGILAIAPNIASIAVWSPGLDESGNSLLGTLALERLTERTGWSVFGTLPPD